MTGLGCPGELLTGVAKLRYTGAVQSMVQQSRQQLALECVCAQPPVDCSSYLRTVVIQLGLAVGALANCAIWVRH